MPAAAPRTAISWTNCLRFKCPGSFSPALRGTAALLVPERASGVGGRRLRRWAAGIKTARPRHREVLDTRADNHVQIAFESRCDEPVTAKSVKSHGRPNSLIATEAGRAAQWAVQRAVPLDAVRSR